MRHRRKTVKLQRDASHKKALLANLVASLIEHKQIRTTLAKAKAMRPLAERMVTLGKKATIHARRLAHGYLHSDAAVKELFGVIAPAASNRKGGYTRITKLGQRHSDSAPMAFIEWVDQAVPAAEEKPAAEPAGEEKKKKPAKTEKTSGDSGEGKPAAKKKPAAAKEKESGEAKPKAPAKAKPKKKED
jgi:large subunit ribosomal protein L17